jgi:ribosomal protein L40E
MIGYGGFTQVCRRCKSAWDSHWHKCGRCGSTAEPIKPSEPKPVGRREQ